jgi:phage shock protein C
MSNDDKPYKKLYRSRHDKMIGGVCAGLADYFQMDATWMRLIFILFLLLGGSALLVYIVMWIIVPLEPESMSDDMMRKE